MQQWAAEEARRDADQWQAAHGLPDQDPMDDSADDAAVISFMDMRWSMLGSCRALSSSCLYIRNKLMSLRGGTVHCCSEVIGRCHLPLKLKRQHARRKALQHIPTVVTPLS